MYDFSRCKLCGEKGAAPLYDLRQTIIYGCPHCDFHYTNSLDGVGCGREGAGLDERSKAYIESRLHPEAVLAGRVAFLKKHIDLPAAKCLDIGTGAGQFVKHLSGVGAQAWGIEPSRLRREFARTKFDLHLNAELVETGYWQEGFSEFFDVVTLWDVLEHVDFPRATIEAVGGVLRPGGLLFLDTPSRDAAPYRLSQWSYHLSGGKLPLFLPSLYAPVPFGHKQIFRREQLVRLLDGAGFRLVTGEGSTLNARGRIVLVCRKAPSRPPP